MAAAEIAQKCIGSRAVLVFADAIPLDLCRRKWPKHFQCLLKFPLLNSGWPPEVDVHFFSSLGLVHPAGLGGYVHAQQGSSFGERLESAVETLAGLGYREIVIVGRDCPDLELSDITLAFSLLESCRLVLGPDHRGGCYLIAFRASDRSLLKNICWQHNRDFDELRKRFGHERTRVMPVKRDLDSLEDVRLLAGSSSRSQGIAASLIQTLESEFVALQLVQADTCQQEMRVSWQLPPPKNLRSS
jgi:Uncharacterized protein conserved in bacteria (DUF2064)